MIDSAFTESVTGGLPISESSSGAKKNVMGAQAEFVASTKANGISLLFHQFSSSSLFLLRPFSPLAWIR